MRCVIFDLDGTLADTSHDLLNAANTCFRSLGLGDVLSHPRDAATAMRGGRAMLRLGFERTASHGPDEIDRQYPHLLEAYSAALCAHSTLFDGVAETLGNLRCAGYRLGICTNKPEALADRLMQDLDLREAFDSLVGADTLPVRKPHPAPLAEAVRRAGGDMRSTVLVGDTPTDRDTSRAAGVPSVLVTFGPLGQAVRDLGPEATIDHYRELPSVVARLIG